MKLLLKNIFLFLSFSAHNWLLNKEIQLYFSDLTWPDFLHWLLDSHEMDPSCRAGQARPGQGPGQQSLQGLKVNKQDSTEQLQSHLSTTTGEFDNLIPDEFDCDVLG